jgi:hypothetical protein
VLIHEEASLKKKKKKKEEKERENRYMSRGPSIESLKDYKYGLFGFMGGTRSHNSTEEPIDPIESISESA